MDLAGIMLAMLSGEADTKTTTKRMYEAYTGREVDEKELDEIIQEVEDEKHGE